MRRHSCFVDTRGGEVRLVAQHSDSACTKGYSGARIAAGFG
jgi:hypothetical protein